jgi:hypothetical protein
MTTKTFEKPQKIYINARYKQLSFISEPFLSQTLEYLFNVQCI